MNIQEFQELSKRTMPKVNDIKSLFSALSNYALGKAGETGEIVDSLKKFIFHGHELDKEQIILELGDDLHYFVGICTLLEIDPEQVMLKNIEKLKRRYPEGFSTERSVNRED